MRYLQLVALTLLGTVVMSMCLMVNEAPTRKSGGGSLVPENPGALTPGASSNSCANFGRGRSKPRRCRRPACPNPSTRPICHLRSSSCVCSKSAPGT